MDRIQPEPGLRVNHRREPEPLNQRHPWTVFPAAEQAVVLEGVQQRVFDVTYQLVAIHGDATDPQRLEQATWMIVQSTRHLAERYVLDAPGFPRDALIDGIARIVAALMP